MKYQLNKGFIFQKLGNKITIFDGEDSVLYTFNEIASYIFGKLKLGLEKERIKELLLKKYAVQEEEARKDLDNLVKDLLDKKIITQIKE